jgi:hypothetical protein
LRKTKKPNSSRKLPTDPRGWITVEKVRIGLGLIATRGFRTNQLIAEIEGCVVTADEVWGYWKTDPRLGANCIRYDADHFLNPDGHIGAYANHCCQPNTGLVKRGRRLVIKAISPIAAGDELTHDYSTFIAADDVWTMRCNCGVEHCRGTVRNINKLPKATLAHYHRLGIVPNFILDAKGE